MKTRFAPSPTGSLHVGGARTALYSWLYARQKGGKFVLRIEDTDQARSTEESAQGIIQDLQWLGLNWDEGPEYQSKRLNFYGNFVSRLVAYNYAYLSYETPEQIAALKQKATDEKRPFRYRRDMPGRETVSNGLANTVVRFQMPNEDITIHDEILGDVVVKADEHDDFIIWKSDFFPTYHLAVVCDDYMMGVTHVLRAQEHLINTAKHIALYRAFQKISQGYTPPESWDIPTYAHFPLVFNMDGSKMSKRDKEKAIKKGVKPPEIDVQDFRRAGYLPEALLNFVALIGWSPGDNKEILALDEMTKLFSFDGIQKAPGKFDRKKLQWMNESYIRASSIDRLLEAFKSFMELVETPLKNIDDNTLREILSMYKERMSTFAEMAENAKFFIGEPVFDQKAVGKFIKTPDSVEYLSQIQTILLGVEDWSKNGLVAPMEQILALGTKRGVASQSLRVAVSGSSVSPPLLETIALLGKTKTLERIAVWLAH